MKARIHIGRYTINNNPTHRSHDEKQFKKDLFDVYEIANPATQIALWTYIKKVCDEEFLGKAELDDMLKVMDDVYDVVHPLLAKIEELELRVPPE